MEIGWMEENTGNYAHNFFLDLISTFGIILSFFILIFLIVMLKKTIYNSNAFFKYFLLLIFVLWFFPLQFSLTIWKAEAFWVFVGANLYMNNKGTLRLQREIKMRVVLQGYNTCCQNKAGGVRERIKKYIHY